MTALFFAAVCQYYHNSSGDAAVLCWKLRIYAGKSGNVDDERFAQQCGYYDSALYSGR